MTKANIQPWSPWITGGRSLLAASMLLSLVLTPQEVFFARLLSDPQRLQCEGLGGASLFCLLDVDLLWVARWSAVLVLALVATGLLPALTAMPFSYVAFSVVSSGTLIDGGDQVVLVLSLLLMPYSLADWRVNAWVRPESVTGEIRSSIAAVMHTLIRIQISVIYLVACVSKLGTPQWPEGTALYYWTRIPGFGAPEWLSGVLYGATSSSLISIALTWGTLLVEFGLGVSMLTSERWRLNVLLPAGAVLHIGILFIMGIASFSLAMCAALLLLLLQSNAEWATLAHRWYARPVVAILQRRRQKALEVTNA